MKKFLLAAVAVATLTTAAGAASAQAYGAPHRPAAPRGPAVPAAVVGYGAGAINARENAIAQRITQGERTGRLDRREVRELRGELAQINAQERQFLRSRGLDRREVAILNARLDRLDAQVTARMRDGRGGGRDGGGYDGRH